MKVHECGHDRKPILSLFYYCCACEGGGKGGVDSVLIESVVGMDSGEHRCTEYNCVQHASGLQHEKSDLDKPWFSNRGET